jgi:hypothetical protein
MPQSSLSFQNSASFRNSLIARTLPPYSVSGAFSSPLGPQNYEINLSEYSNLNLPNIGSTNEADTFYPLNKYGPNGGFVNAIGLQQDPIINSSNEGEYDPSETNLDIVNEFFIDSAYSKNKYGPIGGYNEMFDVTEYQIANQVHQPYFDPIFFTPSKYDPYNLYTQDNPIGSDGSLSSDSYLMRLSATKLETNFNASIAAEEQRQLFRQTTPNLTSTSALAGSGVGTSRDYRITVPLNNVTFLDRLKGDFSPGSPLTGPLFIDEDSNRNPSTGNQIANVLQNTAAGSFNLLADGSSRLLQPSKGLLEQTGAGQISTLYTLLNKNIYRPSYEIGGLGNAVLTGVNSILKSVGASLSGGYYVGSDVNRPEFITSPVNAVPINSYGKLTNAIVFGPDEVGNQYEGPGMEQAFFGLNGISTENGGKPDGGFVWTSPRFKEAAGYKVKKGGDLATIDEEFNQISSSYLFNESTNFGLKQGSILDNTQRLINSADNLFGKRRLKHAGNAINQVSKVFHDGYREITKGSKIMSYVDNATGEEAGIEYCRLFTKDTPYYTFNDLQKSEGMTTENRRFSYSVLDKTYNLNIAPIKGIGSTNVTSKGAKKYMISIENLAWRTSDRPGFTVDELPLCERGPNGGRIMWFPPYDVTFNDGSSASFDEVSFLGRPEPVYTYKNTSRSGKLGFKIVVDHPSIMNLLANKQLEKLGKEKFDQVVKSFIAGCTKYDLYELAAKFNTLPLRELEMYQNLLNDPRLTPEELEQIQNEIPSENTSPENASTIGNTPEAEKNFSLNYEGIGFYFSPESTTNINFEQQINKYISDVNTITQLSPDECNVVGGSATDYKKTNTTVFINNIVKSNYSAINNEFIGGLKDIISNKNIIDLKIEGRNQQFSESVKTFLTEKLKTEIDNKKLTITIGGTLTKNTVKNYVNPTQPQPGASFNTNQTIVSPQTSVTTLTQQQKNNSYPNLAVNCAIISKITIVDDLSNKDPEEENNKNQSSPDQQNPQAVKPQPNTDIQDKLKQAIGKKIIRRLLTECDYFELLKDNDPMVFETLKDKLKFFNPAFHSMTPEGLNARLTFLNQCVRPGQTIPVIGSDGRPKYDDALNTTFGAPPVLVIRVGDFYHTKAIPGALSITYEAPFFDINPEGIGVQPMIVSVSLDLKFIGGHGLARPVETLQNALSFNFYANTEMYDERAEETELNLALLELVDKAIANQTVNNEQSNDGGETIGTVLTTIKSGETESGDIDYTKIYTQLSDQTRDFINITNNQYNTIVDQFNYSMFQLVNYERNYKSGNTITNTASLVDTKLYGKPNDFEKRINKLSSKIKEDINNDTNPIITIFLDIPSLADKDNIIRDTKSKLKKYVESVEKEIIRDIAQPINTIVDTEQNLIKTFNKLNVVTTKKLGNVQTLTGLDGKILPDGNVKIYNLTGDATVFDKLITEYLTVAKTLNDYANLENATKIVPSPTSQFYDNEKCFETTEYSLSNIFTDEGKRFYTLLSQTFTNKDKYELLFVEFVSTPEVEAIPGAREDLTSRLDSLKVLYEEAYSKDKLRMKEGSNNTEFLKLKTFKLEDSTNRRLLYNTQPLNSNDGLTNDKKKEITQIYGQTNWDNDKKTFNGKVKLN